MINGASAQQPDGCHEPLNLATEQNTAEFALVVGVATVAQRTGRFCLLNVSRCVDSGV